MQHKHQSLIGRIAFLFILFFGVTIRSFAGDGLEFIEKDPATGGSMAVVVDAPALLHTAQILPLDQKGAIVAKGGVRQQAEQALSNLSLAMRKNGHDLSGLAKLNVYVAKTELVGKVRGVLQQHFAQSSKPAGPAITFVVGDLPHPDALVAMDGVAISTRRGKGVELIKNRNIFGEDDFAFASITPNCQVAYIAGQADKGNLAEGTAGTLKKLQETLNFLRVKKNEVVQCKAFLESMSEVETVKKEFHKFFAEDGAKVPPLVFVNWSSKEYPIEIETIVSAKNSKPWLDSVEFLTPPDVKPSPVYSKIVRVSRGKLIYFAGLYGKTTPENDVKEIYGTLGELLAKSGTDFEHLAKATYYWSAPASNSRLDAFRPTIYNSKSPPAASKAHVKDVGMEGKGITIDMIGVNVK